jgi:hypothetical protein
MFHKPVSLKLKYFDCSELMSIARYCEDRFLTLVPVLDVEECVDESQLTIMWPVFQQLISSFPNVRYFLLLVPWIHLFQPIIF